MSFTKAKELFASAKRQSSETDFRRLAEGLSELTKELESELYDISSNLYALEEAIKALQHR